MIQFVQALIFQVVLVYFEQELLILRVINLLCEYKFIERKY
jgi:hypothetical protein